MKTGTHQDFNLADKDTWGHITGSLWFPRVLAPVSLGCGGGCSRPALLWVPARGTSTKDVTLSTTGLPGHHHHGQTLLPKEKQENLQKRKPTVFFLKCSYSGLDDFLMGNTTKRFFHFLSRGKDC